MQSPTVKEQAELTSLVPVAETYFSIPQDLGALENIKVLDYLKQHVWLSSKRQKECMEVFLKLNKHNISHMPKVLNEQLEYSNSTECRIFLPMVFLGIALVDLFDFPATDSNMTKLYKYLEHDKMKYREVDYRTWCGISAFAERMACEDPLKFDNLEIADFKYLEIYGDWCDITPALRSVFDVIQKSHDVTVQE